MNEYLIKTLKEARLRKGLKQSDVAAIVGVKANTLSNYENGVSEPDIDTFATLCEIYELDFAYVLGEAYGLSVIGADFDIKPSEIELIRMYRELNEHGRKMVNFTLLEEHKHLVNISSDSTVTEFISHEAKAAHERTDIEVTDEMRKHDDDIMDDENF